MGSVYSFNIKKVRKTFGGFMFIGKRGLTGRKQSRVILTRPAVDKLLGKGVDPTRISGGKISLHFHYLEGEAPDDEKQDSKAA